MNNTLSRGQLKSLDPSVQNIAYLKDGVRGGLFIWNEGNFSSAVISDPCEGVFIPSATLDPSVGAWVRDYTGNGVVDVWFGVERLVSGSAVGIDSTPYLQAALNFCRINRKDLLLSAGSTFVTAGKDSLGQYALLNEGVSMIGLPSKSTLSVIKPLSNMPATADFIRFRPTNNSGQDFIQFSNFMVMPKPFGTSYGRRALFGMFDLVTNVGQMKVSRLYLGEGNDYSIYLQNSINTNAQGNPSNSTIEECSLWEGVYLTGVGDNVSIKDNFIISGVGSGRHGIYSYQVDGGGGVASYLEVSRNAMNANGSAILVDRARNLRIRDNNIEHSHGQGVNASVINLRGSGGRLSMPIVEGNAVGIFGNSSAQIGINVQSAYFAQVDNNNIITDVARMHAIAVGASSQSTRITFNKVSPEWVNSIMDSGSDSVASGTVESGI
jgi:hypothetical protein